MTVVSVPRSVTGCSDQEHNGLFVSGGVRQIVKVPAPGGCPGSSSQRLCTERELCKSYLLDYEMPARYLVLTSYSRRELNWVRPSIVHAGFPDSICSSCFKCW